MLTLCTASYAITPPLFGSHKGHIHQRTNNTHAQLIVFIPYWQSCRQEKSVFLRKNRVSLVRRQVRAKTQAKTVISDWCHRFRGDDNIIDYSHAWRSELSVKIGKIFAIFQSKTLIPESKNQIFIKFFKSFLTKRLRFRLRFKIRQISTQTRR